MICKIAFLTVIVLNTVIKAQAIPSPYEIGTWNGFRDAAITYTFDDNCSNQLLKAVPLFDQFGYKLTLFTVPEWVSDWTVLKNAASKGHEIASHTVTHTNLAELNTTEQNYELSNSKNEIENHLSNYKCLTVAYPYCIKSDDSITSKYYIAARGGRGGIESSTPESFMDINSIDCGNAAYELNSLDEIKTTFESAATSNGWCILVIHGIDNDGGYGPLSSTILNGSLQYLNEYKSKYWIITFRDAVKYIKERNNAVIREISSQINSFTIQVTDNLPDSIYNLPITIRRPLPSTWNTASAEQNGKQVPSSIIMVNSVRYIMFDVVPDNGNIIIKQDITIPPSKYEIGTWNGFRSAAVTFTFDDGSSNQYNKAMPLFDLYGYKMTFFTVTEWVSDWSKLIKAAANGHEIASHTVTHPRLSNLSINKQNNELKNSKNTINNYIQGKQCMTLAYPYCVRGDDSTTSKYYIAARGGRGGIESSTPASFMDINSIDCGNAAYELNSLDEIKTTFESAATSNGWCILVIHGIDNDGGYGPLSSTILNGSLQYLNEYKSKYWIITFRDAVKYIKERNSAVIREISSQNNSFTIQVTDNLADSIYNYPITIRRPLPATWQNAVVEQNGKLVQTTITNVNSVQYIMFDAVPDKGNIVIRQDIGTIKLSKTNFINSVKVENSLTKTQIVVETGMALGSTYDITMFDLKGAVITRYTVRNVNNTTGLITLPSDGIIRSSSRYILRISDGEHVWTGLYQMKGIPGKF